MKRSLWMWFVPALIVLTALAAGEQFARSSVAKRLLPTREAEWIWAPDQEHSHRPIAFYAATEFDLPFAVESAELTSLADEESVLFVNGHPVGATRYGDGKSLPVYDVADLLQPGANRLQAELRSTRGVGAFLLSLEIAGEGESTRIVSDESWRIFYMPHPDLFASEGELPEGDRPEVWGLPPAGRWSVPQQRAPTRTIDQLRSADEAVAASRWRIWDERGPGAWLRARRPDRFSPGLGYWITFDFRRTLTGFLAFRFPIEVAKERAPLGLIFVGDHPRSVKNQRPDAFLVGMPGQRVWLDSEPRRFRYVTFVGLVETSGVELYQVDPSPLPPLSDESAAPEVQIGAFGLQSARLRTPLENEVWRELHGLPSGAGREDR